jgi:hypothetical protein
LVHHGPHHLPRSRWPEPAARGRTMAGLSDRPYSPQPVMKALD